MWISAFAAIALDARRLIHLDPMIIPLLRQRWEINSRYPSDAYGAGETHLSSMKSATSAAVTSAATPTPPGETPRKGMRCNSLAILSITVCCRSGSF